MAAEKYKQLEQVVKDGKLLTATRKELEGYAKIVCLGGFSNHFAAQGQQIGDTVRLMLLVRISEQTHKSALITSWCAIAVAVVAAVLAGIGTFRICA